MQYNFEWDPAKAGENLHKHQVSFERAPQVFLDPFARSLYDGKHSDEQARWITLGKNRAEVSLVVVHTFREVDLDHRAIRLISARKATRGERASTTLRGASMRKEYDFSKGAPGKFYRPDVRLNLPIYLDDDVAEVVQRYARRRQVDAQAVVKEILRGNLETLLQALL